MKVPIEKGEIKTLVQFHSLGIDLGNLQTSQFVFDLKCSIINIYCPPLSASKFIQLLE